LNRAYQSRRAWLLPLLAALAVFLLVPVARGQETSPKIIDIIVLGNKALNRESIVSASGLRVGDPLTQTALDEAKRRLLATGNFGTHFPDEPEKGVQIRAEISGEGAKVVIEVDENDVVRGFNLTGTGPIPAADILALLQTKAGFVLNLPTLASDVRRIQQHYETKGYQAFISEDLGLREGILHIPIIVGKIGKVVITGLRKTRQEVVLREMKQLPGTYYNIFELRKDLTRIYNTDLFESVDPTFNFPQPGTVDVNLNIQEKRTGQVAVSVGYSNRGGIIGRAEIGETNLFGRGQQVNFLWETGGFANRNSFEIGFTEPWLDRHRTSLSVSLFDRVVYRFARSLSSGVVSTVGTEDDYFETHTGGQITVGRPLSETLRGFVGFRYDNVRVPALKLDVNDAALLQNGPLASVNLRLVHNTRDFDLEPAAGGYEVLTTDIGRADLKPVGTVNGQTPSGVFGILNYTKFGIDVRRYFSPQGRRQTPNDKRNVFALRLMLASSTGKLPFSEQYFVGGAESLRGYQEDRFWGENMLLGSFEFRTPLANSLTGVIFADVGDAWGGLYDKVTIQGFTQHSGFRPNAGFGIGLRVRTPIGPIRIDQGFGSEGARTHFSIGHVF